MKHKQRSQARSPNYPLPTIHYPLLFLLFLAISCRTTQHIPDTALLDTGYLPLDADASVYVTIDVVNARPVLDLMEIGAADNRQFAQMLDMTRFAAAAYFTGSDRRFQVHALGSYPAGRAKMALGANKNWKKRRSAQSGEEYWYSAKNGLSVALEPQRAFAAVAAAGVNQETPADPFYTKPGTKIPDGFAEFGRGAALAFWLENPGSIINGKLQEMGLPLEIPAEQVFVSLFPEAESAADGTEAEYTAYIRIQTFSETQARAFTGVLGFARMLFPADAASGGAAMLMPLLFAHPPVQDGRNLTIKTNTMTAREIALLFSLFSL
ncbi:MAG: hypothetical protein FWG46_06205 [Treponema sp.]|nr:hypothetical protein [Treponema sp.]